MIDLRSDTVTRPTSTMRRAMAEAPVGDDVYGDDPSIRALERRTAEMLGKDDAVFMVSGTMTNQVALRAHTESGDEVLADAAAHIAVLERGAPAALSGLTLRGLPGRHGVFSADDVRAAIRLPHPFLPAPLPTKLLCLENTHNLGGGAVWPIDVLRDVVSAARAAGLAAHLDGARLWNAAVACGVTEAVLAAPFDSVSVCFSKGLGAPVGSALAGPREFVARARRFKALFGGGIRQGGIVAAGALWAVEHHRARLVEDHARARRLAERLATMPGVDIDPSDVVTNIVRFRLDQVSAADFVNACFARGVHLLPVGPSGVRAVTHLDIDDDDIDRASTIIEGVLVHGSADVAAPARR